MFGDDTDFRVGSAGGAALALCSDDPSVFGNMGLTFDFFQVRSKSPLRLLLLTYP